MNDILLKMNSQYVTLLVMLDLSAALDTFNRKILLHRLQHDIGFSGVHVTLQWINSYLSNRSQRIAVQGTLPRVFDLDCGVPQGSSLGPLLYVICASELFNIIERHLPDAHCYADDSQLYLGFRPADGLSSQTDAIQAMERCIDDIRHWMVSDRLLLNDKKTEFLLIGTRQQLAEVDPLHLRVGTMDIEPKNCVRNLGAWFDSMLSMETHINKVCSSGFYYLNNFIGIRGYLSQECLVTLIHGFVTSRLDYCNSLMYGLPQCQISKLQSVQNAGARIALDRSKFSHITTVIDKSLFAPVFAVSETWLKPSITDNESQIPGYSCVRSDRLHKTGGGTKAYVRNGIPYRIRPDLGASLPESCAIEISRPKCKKLIIWTIYRAPDLNLETFFSRFGCVFVFCAREGRACFARGFQHNFFMF